MKNILGTTEDLELYNKEGVIVYEFENDSNGFSCESIYDLNGYILTYKDSNGFSYEQTNDSNGNTLNFKNSAGYWWESTYDSNGNELTYKNSNGVTRGFEIPEYTMEELVEKLGNFKIKK